MPFVRAKKSRSVLTCENEEVLWGMNLEEPIYFYRQVPGSLKGKNKGFLFFLS